MRTDLDGLRPDAPRRRMTREQRAEQLAVVAESVIADRGFQAASMDEIAERAGVTKPILYDHFGSKDGLLAAVIVRRGAELKARTEQAVTGADGPADALARGLRAYFTFISEHAQAWSVVFTESASSPAAAEAVEAVRRELALFITALVSGELPDRDDGRARVYAQAVIGACERLAVCAASDPSLDTDRITNRLMDVLWLGFASLRAGERWGSRAAASTDERVDTFPS